MQTVLLALTALSHKTTLKDWEHDRGLEIWQKIVGRSNLASTHLLRNIT